MGCFNSIIIECPNCKEQVDEQFKPGYMKAYWFPRDILKMPIEYVQYMQNRELTCWSCKQNFKTDVELKITIENPRVMKL